MSKWQSLINEVMGKVNEGISEARQPSSAAPATPAPVESAGGLGGGMVRTIRNSLSHVQSAIPDVVSAVKSAREQSGVADSSGGHVGKAVGDAMGSVGKVGEFDPSSMIGKAISRFGRFAQREMATNSAGDRTPNDQGSSAVAVEKPIDNDNASVESDSVSTVGIDMDDYKKKIGFRS